MKRLCFAAFLGMASTIAFAAEFTVKDVAGQTHRLADYRGKWVLVNFWATWCAPCLKEIPDFSALYDARKGRDLVVLGVAMDFDNPKEVTDYARKLSMSYPLVLGDDDTAAQFGRVVGLPTSYLYDPKGNLALKKIGPLPKETIENMLDRK
jgi:peroxiredoxin